MRINSNLYLLIVLALAGISGFIFAKFPFKYGLDVQGGIRLTYQIDSSKLTPAHRENFPTIVRNTEATLQRRVEGALAVAEATVVFKAPDRFIVELPGATNVKEAMDVLGTTASIKWYHARTVSNPAARRTYETVDQPEMVNDAPVYNFRRASDPNSLIKPNTPEYLAIIRSWGEPLAEGGDLASATVRQNRGGYAPFFVFSGEGGKKLETWSRTHRFNQENLAAVLDDMVLSIAPLERGAILESGGEVYINMAEPMANVKRLTDLLNSGALPVDLVVLQSEQVDPTIGSQALGQILNAGLIAVVVIALFVLVYYMFPGFVALLALGLYLLLTLAMLKLLNATFSLAAIAGVILSVGMAVDANVLIFERIKEELRSGKTIKAAVDLGFKRAFPAILDSNACTIITSLVLMAVGTGAVRGFASTLMLGVALSLFTAVTVTRWLLGFFIGVGIGTNKNAYGLKRQWFGEGKEAEAGSKPLHIVAKRNMFFAISVLTIVIPGIFFFMGGLKLNAEFLGGYEGTYAVQNESTVELSRRLEQAGYKGGNVKIAQTSGGKVAYITIPPEEEFKGKTDIEVRDMVRQALGFSAEQDKGFNAVGPTIRQEAINNAMLGVLYSTVGIIAYLAFRFGIALGGFLVGLRFALATVGALLHDILVVVALAALFGFIFNWEVSALFVTAMLTVVGFSTHDTIVIFDRIRENLRKPIANEDIGQLIDRSITQSIARSINTSSTVIVTLILLITIGSATPDLKFFNVVMLCGIISGTYSSIFNAAPILYVIERFIGKSKGEAHTLLGIARREQAHVHVATTVPTGEGQGGLQSEGYGQVRRRRASDASKGRVQIDDE